MKDIRTGQGYDAHRFAKDRKLILGGVTVDYEVGLLGHSDADVLAHAIADSILGALALSDIGVHFPPNDPEYKDANSIYLLSKVAKMVNEKGYLISNIDSTVIAQEPKISPYIEKMRHNISNALNVETDRVSVKATTTEGMGPTGRKEGIEAIAVATLYKE